MTEKLNEVPEAGFPSGDKGPEGQIASPRDVEKSEEVVALEEEAIKEEPTPGGGGEVASELLSEEACGEAREEILEAKAGKEGVEGLEEEITRLKAELEETRQKAENYYWRLLRMEADFENYRRRVQAEKEELQLYAAQRVVAALLPVLDNLERGLEASRRSRDFDGLIAGLELVHRGFKELLQREGLEEIETIGREFDPQYHEAMGRVPAEENQPDNIVVEELQKGYFFKGKVIRPARVMITYRET